MLLIYEPEIDCSGLHPYSWGKSRSFLITLRWIENTTPYHTRDYFSPVFRGVTLCFLIGFTVCVGQGIRLREVITQSREAIRPVFGSHWPNLWVPVDIHHILCVSILFVVSLLWLCHQYNLWGKLEDNFPPHWLVVRSMRWVARNATQSLSLFVWPSRSF